MSDDELEAIRRRKMQEIQQQAAAEEQVQAQRQQYEAQKQTILRVILEPEARERLTRVRMARPEVAEAVEQQLVALYQQGRIRGQITDDVLRDFLSRVNPKPRDIKIERR